MSRYVATPITFNRPNVPIEQDQLALARTIANAPLYDPITTRPLVFHRDYELYYQTTLPDVIFGKKPVPISPPSNGIRQ